MPDKQMPGSGGKPMDQGKGGGGDKGGMPADKGGGDKGGGDKGGMPGKK